MVMILNWWEFNDASGYPWNIIKDTRKKGWVEGRTPLSHWLDFPFPIGLSIDLEDDSAAAVKSDDHVDDDDEEATEWRPRDIS